MPTKRSTKHLNMVLRNKVSRRLERLYRSYQDKGGLSDYDQWIDYVIEFVIRSSCKINRR